MLWYVCNYTYNHIYIYIRVQICFKIYIISSTYLATYFSDNLFTVAQWVPVGWGLRGHKFHMHETAMGNCASYDLPCCPNINLQAPKIRKPRQKLSQAAWTCSNHFLPFSTTPPYWSVLVYTRASIVEQPPVKCKPASQPISGNSSKLFPKS